MSAEPTDAQVNAAALEYFGVSATYDRERMRAALRAAAAVAEESKWEHGIRLNQTGTVDKVILWPEHEDTHFAGSRVRRVAAVPAGPWVPVKQEGATDAV